MVAYWLEAAAAKRPLRVLGDPRTVRDYVYVDDVVEVMARIHRIACASGAESLPDVLNIGSGVPTSLMDMLAAVVTTVGGVVSVEFAGGRPFDRSDVWLDVTKARRCVGWSARTPLELGVQRTWAHLTRQRLVNGPDGRNE
ncbi:GDP-mannose 4,6-dehydratase [Nocardia arthritidis]|uniref:NAD-dependent epimerase/dehydratase family protein n=1 Tax=Nocardia arthritidis TaxID=228602 RepID=A0A6G9Y9V0_9NOCA|nr:NAD-dependent epimerase/dehydratase family protein [Nocardia arthritidis]